MKDTEMSLEKQEQAVFVKSNPLPEQIQSKVNGYDFNNGVDYSKLLESYRHTGFQATALSMAIGEISRMINAKCEPVAFDDGLKILEYPTFKRQKTGCTIFLGYTSNMISCGIREIIRYLVQHNMIDCIVTSAGGVEEDFIKCLAPTYLGDFGFHGSDLRKNGINRIGNLLVPNDNYCKFEDWVLPILDQMLKEQNSNHFSWTPSKMINRLGKEINNEESVYYWAYKNNIPVFCPGLTDGSLGDMLYFHSYKNPGLILDIIEDVRLLNDTAVHSSKTGIIILGGGLVKHHICNANLMRNGAEFAVFVNTAQEFDGSDSGAQPDEAVSWGKIKMDAKPVKVHCDASIAFPLIVGETFAKNCTKLIETTMKTQIYTNRGEIPKATGQVMLTKQYDGIRISPALRRPTSSIIELKNVSDDWIAYKTKCTHPTNFTIKPSPCGLMAPKESQTLRLNLLPGYGVELRGVELLLETFFATITNDETMDAARLWEESVSSDITGTRFAINVVDTKLNENERLIVCFDKFPDGVEKSVAAKMKSVLERMQNEDFVAKSLVTLLVVFIVAFFVGYVTHKMQCRCDNDTCHATGYANQHQQ